MQGADSPPDASTGKVPAGRYNLLPPWLWQSGWNVSSGDLAVLGDQSLGSHIHNIVSLPD